MYAGVPSALPVEVRAGGDDENRADDDRVGLAALLGQAPVDDDGLAEGPDHDVGRLQVSVDHAARVRVGHRLAGVDDVGQERKPRLERIACREARFQRLAADELLRAEERAVRPARQLVDRHDSG